MNQRGNKRNFMLVLLIGIGLVGLLLAYTVLTIPATQDGFYHDREGGPLTDQGKVVVLYVGALSCPFCAAERWAIVDALSSFGNWSGLQPSLSGPASVEPQFPNIPTYSFANSSFTGTRVSFQAVELLGRLGTPLQRLDTSQQSVINKDDPSGSIPFISVGGEYYKLGSGVNVTLLLGMSFSQVKQSIESGQGRIYDSVKSESHGIAATLDTVLRNVPTPAGQVIQGPWGGMNLTDKVVPSRTDSHLMNVSLH